MSTDTILTITLLIGLIIAHTRFMMDPRNTRSRTFIELFTGFGALYLVNLLARIIGTGASNFRLDPGEPRLLMIIAVHFVLHFTSPHREGQRFR
jgi:hypothetical protein